MKNDGNGRKSARIRWRTAAMTILLVFMIAACAGCSLLEEEEALPADTLEEFESAMNAMDVNAMMDCLDDSAVKTVEASLGLVLSISKAVTGVDLGISASDLIALMPVFQGIALESGYNQGMPQVDFQVDKTYIKGSKATVYYTELNSSQPMVVNMKKDDDEWKITLSTQVIAESEADRIIIAGEEESESGDSGDSAGTISDLLENVSLKDILNFDLEGFLSDLGIS